MIFDLDTNLDIAIKVCNNEYPQDYNNNIYPFTTENISGYIDYFNLGDNSLLTVGSSGDQVINAILKGCKDVTLLDRNPYSKFYYYLKVASILCLDLESFLEFLRYEDYPKVFRNNTKVFNKQSYEKIKSTLKSLDYDSYIFWDELFGRFHPLIIRDNLFSKDEDRTYVIVGCNNYLKSDENYRIIKDKLKEVNPNFIYGDLLDIELNNKYDNIWLSNVGTILNEEDIKTMTDKMSKLLNMNSRLLISYLYLTTKDSKYQDNWTIIYDLQNTFKLLKDYNPELISFLGVDGIKFKDYNSNAKDSILVYHKK